MKWGKLLVWTPQLTWQYYTLLISNFVMLSVTYIKHSHHRFDQLLIGLSKCYTHAFTILMWLPSTWSKSAPIKFLAMFCTERISYFRWIKPNWASLYQSCRNCTRKVVYLYSKKRSPRQHFLKSTNPAIKIVGASLFGKTNFLNAFLQNMASC